MAFESVETQKGTKYISTRIGRNVFATPPRISVIVPAYNAADTIVEAIDSALAQKYREHEIIVVNDGSPDTERLERALSQKMEEITYIKQRNQGAGVARNTAIEHARGEIIAFLDADDVWLPEFLASQYVFLERNSLDMVYCDAVMFGMKSAYRQTFMESAPSDGDVTVESLLDLKCNVITSGTMVRKSAVLAAGGFETERVRAHDFHLWIRIARNGGKIGYQRKQLLKYRVSPDGLSGDSVSRAERELDAFHRVRKTVELTPEQAAIADHRISGLEADLAVERGKASLLRGDYKEAASKFSLANQYRRSPKLTAITLMTRVAPSLLLKFYTTNRRADIELAPRHS
jgi:glycosyltransferase involved in cell wall biosynthesis